ncbi:MULTISPECIES: TRAP transporter small permease [unclassified Yoonia]|uniref:TRAP transporter small permease n=1 Tax=unclassified Yoonia TaxID=2629118 RepID=UPI002AFE144A|nr:MULTISPECIES: TRAP transporter small permease [unclassified Yoonia]
MIRFVLRDFEKIICAILFLAMTALGFVNVVVRYGTNYSFAATEELLVNGFLLLTVFGAAIAARRGEHLAVTVVHDLLPRVFWLPILGLSVLLSVALLSMSAWFSWEAMMNIKRVGMQSYGLGLPAWYYQAALPFGFALIALRYLQHAFEVMRAGPDAKADHV